MLELAEFLHYISIALVVGVNAVSVGIGEGMTGSSAIEAINIQPQAKNEITTAAIIGMALVETAAITGISIAMILLLGAQGINKTIYFGLSELGIAFAVSFSGFAIGIVSAWPAQSSCLAIARQPFIGKKIFRFMLITQSLIQTPVIFSFIIAMFIKNQSISVNTAAETLRLIASGLCIGLGSIGPAIGQANFARAACSSIGVNKKSYNKIFPFTLISEAIIETPIIFALVVSLILIGSKASTLLQGIAMISAAFCIGIGTIGPGIGSGKTSAQACKQIAKNPEIYSTISKVSMFGQGMIDTAAIYALMISLSLILFV